MFCGCPLDTYRSKGGTKYKVVLERKTYSAAKQTCAAAGGRLAVIKTEAVYNFLLRLIQDTDGADGKDYWFGLTGAAVGPGFGPRTAGRSWTWSDGTPLSDCSFTKWAPGEPNYLYPQNCAHLWSGAGHQWDDTRCNYENYFVCQIGPGEKCDKGSESLKYTSLLCWRDSEDRAIPTLEGTDPRLDGSYLFRQNPIDKCYQVALSRGFTVFGVQHGGWCAGSADAQNTYNKYGPSTACAADGEGGGMANEVYKITGQDAYTKMPRKHGRNVNKDGGYLHGCSPGWTGQNCQQALRCQRGWSKYNNHCYKSMTDKVGWSTANSRCKQHGAMLTSINDGGENNFIASLVSNVHDTRWVPSIWLGLSKESGQWKWTDGSRADYTNWAPGEPSASMFWSLGHGEKCVSVYTKTGINGGFVGKKRYVGQWNDVRCGTRYPYICEKPI
ncbi:macrophage mannose receptor 1-like [Branchiostoma lanceolatum]|uniref:macrophage mannose receptor 1-like n=1 Tax=Branchiostoma lanceolatum TaxID=7740 RepID=UPI0034518B1B